MTFLIETEQETDGRWIAEVVELPGVLAYGQTVEEAKAKVQALALRVVADRLEHGEAGADLLNISFAAARPNGPAHARSGCWPPSSVSAGPSSDKSAPIAFFPATAGLTWCLLSMIQRRSALGCWPVLRNGRDSAPRICSMVWAVTSPPKSKTK